MVKSIFVICTLLILPFIWSFAYYLYLTNKSDNKSFIIPALVVSFLAILLYNIISNSVLGWLFSSILVFLFLLILIKYFLPPKLIEKKKILEIDNIPIYVCKTKEPYLNAWYNVREKSAYITETLRNILTKKELEVVIRHEIAHSKQKDIILAVLLIFSALIFWTTVVFFFVLCVTSNLKYLEYILFLLFVFNISILISIYFWSKEHEADRHAVRSHEDIKHLAMCLMKMDIYHTIEEEFKPLIIPSFKNWKEIERYLDLKFGKYTFWNFLKDFLRLFIFKIPKTIIEILHKEIFLTHPPLKFRIMYLLRSVGDFKSQQ